MEYKLTHKVDSHHINPSYKCLLIDLLPLPEFHFEAKAYGPDGKELKDAQIVLTKADLIPRNEWLMEVIQQMVNWKPTEFYPILYHAVIMGDLEKGEWG